MRCFHPIDAWQTEDGRVVFSERGAIRRALTLPCGRCIGCRLTYSEGWAIRMMHESQCHSVNSFVTLTYNDNYVQTSLDYRDFQLFMRRLRKEFSDVRFYCAGEYTDAGRPHFHAALFNCHFADRKFYRTLPSGFDVYRSALLERLWPYGFSTIGSLSFESAQYIAKYVTKRVVGDKAEEHYTRVDIRTGEIVQVTPEFSKMSLKPGIGALWFDKFKDEVYPRDKVVVSGREVKPPRYYDKKADVCVFSDVEFERMMKEVNEEDSTPERLRVQEKVITAKVNFFKRGKDYE